MSKTIKANETTPTFERLSYGFRDRFNRILGSRIKTYECDFVEASPDARTYWPMEPGHYFAMHAMATRNQELYGPSQCSRYFKTREERDEAIYKYIHGAQKRAQKREGR